MAIKHLNIKIYGKVQGVGFRLSAQNLANKLNINGFIRNEEDGTVYLEVEGEEENLKKFLDWCKKGPFMARVDKIEFKLTSILKNFIQFDTF